MSPLWLSVVVVLTVATNLEATQSTRNYVDMAVTTLEIILQKQLEEAANGNRQLSIEKAEEVFKTSVDLAVKKIAPVLEKIFEHEDVEEVADEIAQKVMSHAGVGEAFGKLIESNVGPRGRVVRAYYEDIKEAIKNVRNKAGTSLEVLECLEKCVNYTGN